MNPVPDVLPGTEKKADNPVPEAVSRRDIIPPRKVGKKRLIKS
jgi:hypothetical protein